MLLLIVECVAQALKQNSREATVLLYAPSLGPHLEKMMDLADKVFRFYEGQEIERVESPRHLLFDLFD